MHFSEAPPAEIDVGSGPIAGRWVDLAVNGITLDAYDVYDLDNTCAIALHFTLTIDEFDTRSVFLGTQLRTQGSGVAFSSGGGRLSAHLSTSTGAHTRRDPFVLWFTFGLEAGNWESIAAHNGESMANEAQDLVAEIYLSPGDMGLTFVEDSGVEEDCASLHVQIPETNLHPRR